MKYSIVVISKDRRDWLERCLENLKKIEQKPQIILVEASDGDDPVNIEGIKYIKIPADEGGFSKQRNLGVENSDGEYIIFSDDDVEITPQWYDKLISLIEANSNLLGTAGAVFPLRPNIVGFCEGVLGHPAGGFKLHNRADSKPLPLNQISTCNTIIKKSVIKEAGDFDPRNKYGSEDTDISIRIIEKFGEKGFLFNPDALVYHLPRNSIRKIIPWYVRRGKADADLFLKHTVHVGYLLKTLILLKIIPFIILSFIFKTPYILLVAFLFWYALQLKRSKFMWKYFKYYNFSKIKQRVTYCVFPLIKLIADVMFDFGRIIRVIRFHEE